MIKNILCIGAGYVGGPTMAVIAKNCPDLRVVVVDINEERIRAWQSGKPPIFEPGLEETVRASLNRNLFFSTDIPTAIAEADIIFVSVNTPTKTFGDGAGYAADLQYWEKTARQILEHSSRDKIVVEKSTVPVQTAQAMENILSQNAKGLVFDVLSNPEFLAEGTAIGNLENADRVLIGGAPTERGGRAVEELAAVYRRWLPDERILRTNVWSSELSKLAANAFLAQRISSINSLTPFCEKTGADIAEVARAVGMDGRIGSRFLQAGVGFGGSCFKKDVLNLVYLCRNFGLQEVADYWEQVVRINEYQKCRFVKNMVQSMFNTVAEKRIALFGFAFKADTGDTRESPAITVCRELVAEHARVVVTDPEALENAGRDLADLGESVEFEDDPYRAAEGAHAVALLTGWSLYREIDYQRIFDSMSKPAWVFDGRNLLDHARLAEIGFNVSAVGKKPVTRFSKI